MWSPMSTMLWLGIFLRILVEGSYSLYTPADNYLLVCGSPQNVTFLDRTYVPDSTASTVSLKNQGNSFVATSNPTAPFPIYQSARVFRSTASYKFDIKKEGRHWIRLYLYPIPGHNLTSASITAVTEDFVLLHNFSFDTFNGSHLFKEYLINIKSDSLAVTFIPSNNSVTFVNAIEVVSVPDNLIPDQTVAVSPPGPYAEISGRALETVYRLNMGGPLITPQNDTLGRTWENDVKYLHVNSSAINVSVNHLTIRYPPNIAPEIAPNWVYATAETMGDPNVANNITWVLPVDPDFIYFVRVHFCDIVSKSMNSMVFNLYINNDTASGSLDLAAQVGHLAVPYYKDFVTNVAVDSDKLSVCAGPDSTSDVIDAIMNGLEIMKMSNDHRSFVGHSAVEILVLPPKKNKIGIIAGSVGGAVVALVFIGLCCCYCLVAKRNARLPQKSGTASCISLASSNHGRFFTFQEIKDATNNFDESLLLGVGGFGRVYKGTLEDGTRVAVKRGIPKSGQGLGEFRTEIEILSKLCHRHLLSLIGYCNKRSEMILVYEYMANGPLRSHLYGADLPALSWKQRLEICIGAAKGLHYLHTGAAPSIIHRDVKTTNILLDENFVAKVADFGISKTVPAPNQTHVSTAVKGSFGYLDPEYFMRQQLTQKSDVYSFGVVLMEVLCTRPALNPILPDEQVNIAEWAMPWQKKGMLDQIMDKNLVGKVNPASLKKFGETAVKCLAEDGADRPPMGDVLWNLECALQLEETSSALVKPDHNTTNHVPHIPSSPLQPDDAEEDALIVQFSPSS